MTKYSSKKILRYSFILIWLSITTGCYSLESVQKESLIIESYKYQKKDIYIITENYYEYYFEGLKHKIENDTLYGEGTVKKWEKENRFNGKIPMNEILEIKIKDSDQAATLGLVAGIVTLLLVIPGLIVGLSLASSS